MHGYKWYLYLSTWNSLFVSIAVWYLSYNIMDFFSETLYVPGLYFLDHYALLEIPGVRRYQGKRQNGKEWRCGRGMQVAWWGVGLGVMARGHCAEALASLDWTPKRILCHLLHHSKSDLERQARPQSSKALDVLPCHLLRAKLWEISKIKFGFDNSSE